MVGSGVNGRGCSMIPTKLVPDLIRDRKRFSQMILLKQNVRARL